MSLPTEWEECAGIEGVECKLDGGSLLFRDSAKAVDGPGIIGWWVRPPSVHHSTAVIVFSERGGNTKLGNARTFPQARDKVAKFLGR